MKSRLPLIDNREGVPNSFYLRSLLQRSRDALPGNRKDNETNKKEVVCVRAGRGCKGVNLFLDSLITNRLADKEENSNNNNNNNNILINTVTSIRSIRFEVLHLLHLLHLLPSLYTQTPLYIHKRVRGIYTSHIANYGRDLCG